MTTAPPGIARAGDPTQAPAKGQKQPPPYAPYRSRLEMRYAAWLEDKVRQGVVTRWRYEAIRLRLAPQTTLTVDFIVTMADMDDVQFHEVKGSYRREDSWAKLKIAAALYPEWRFVLVQEDETHNWTWEEVPAQ